VFIHYNTYIYFISGNGKKDVEYIPRILRLKKRKSYNMVSAISYKSVTIITKKETAVI